MEKPPGGPSEFPLGPSLDFLQRLWRLNHALERLSLGMDRRLGITAQQRFVIRCVGKFPGLSSGQLAKILHLDPGTISTALGRLEAKGLVERRRDPADSRRVALGLTRAGRALDIPTPGTVEDAAEELLSELAPAETRSTVAALDRLTDLLQARAAAVDHGEGSRRRSDKRRRATSARGGEP